MTRSISVGSRVWHIKRESEYKIIGEIEENLARKFKDGDRASFNVYRRGRETVAELVPVKTMFAPNVMLTFLSLPVGVQISDPRDRYDLVLIYQAVTDGKIWARYKDEFTINRFTVK